MKHDAMFYLTKGIFIGWAWGLAFSAAVTTITHITAGSSNWYAPAIITILLAGVGAYNTRSGLQAVEEEGSNGTQ